MLKSKQRVDGESRRSAAVVEVDVRGADGVREQESHGAGDVVAPVSALRHELRVAKLEH